MASALHAMLCLKTVDNIDSKHGAHASTHLVSSGMSSLAVLNTTPHPQGCQPADIVMTSFAGNWNVGHQALSDTAEARQKPGRQVSIHFACWNAPIFYTCVLCSIAGMSAPQSWLA